jgi:hypothetical protein
MTLAGWILMLIWQIVEDILASGRGIAMVPYRGKSPASNEDSMFYKEVKMQG